MYRRLHRVRAPSALLFLLATLAPAATLAGSMSEAEALRLGLGRPELGEIARAQIGEARADALAARLWANPTLELAGDKTGASRETTWQLSLPVDLSGRRSLRQEAASRRIDAAEAGNRAQMNERAAAVRRAFYQFLLQQEALRAVDAWAARFTQISGVVDKLARAGEASGYDRRRLAREQTAAAAKAAETRAALERSGGRLGALIGADRVAEEGVGGRLLPLQPADLAALQATLLQRPDLAALAARAEAANAENAATRRLFPEVTVGVGGKQVDDGIVRDSGALFSVSIPLPIFDRQQAGERRTAAQALAARAEYRLAQQTAAGELLGLHRQLTQLIAAAERYRRDAVAPSAELVRIAEAAYRAGESTVLELLDAYRGALEAETTAIDLEWKARDASIELDQLTGNYPQ